MTKKSARPGKAESSTTRQGAQINTHGGFPPRLASVCAEVLARFLNHERLTSLDAVAEASTTRLSAVVHYLEKEHGWCIESIDKAAGCSDGRVAWVSVYYLSAETVILAMAAGAGQWCASVRAARRKQRNKAAEARRSAERLNTMRQRPSSLGQRGLFDGEI
jgi:hypothetical protein